MIEEQPTADENADEGPDIKAIPAFIEEVLAGARAQDGADNKLLDILEKHIVRQEPSPLPVDSALSDIDELAETRSSQGGTDGESDHD